MSFEKQIAILAEQLEEDGIALSNLKASKAYQVAEQEWLKLNGEAHRLQEQVENTQAAIDLLSVGGDQDATIQDRSGVGLPTMLSDDVGMGFTRSSGQNPNRDLPDF